MPRFSDFVAIALLPMTVPRRESIGVFLSRSDEEVISHVRRIDPADAWVHVSEESEVELGDGANLIAACWEIRGGLKEDPVAEALAAKMTVWIRRKEITNERAVLTEERRTLR